MALLAYLVAVVTVVIVLRRYVFARRGRLGLVQITRSHSTWSMAVARVAPEHVAEGRALHDALLSAIRAGGDDGEVAAIEARMRELTSAAGLR